MRRKHILSFLAVVVLLLLLGYKELGKDQNESNAATSRDYDVQITFPSQKYPETAKHIKDAIAAGEPEVCTIKREAAEEHRKESLRNIPTKKGYDRDEWPMAMCAEGGEGANIEYISPSDNRGAGSWVGNELDNYPDGTRVEFLVQ